MKIALLGSGALAENLAFALQNGGHEIVQVFSRTLGNARSLAEKIGCKFTADFGEITEAELYIYAISDSALAEVARKKLRKNGIHIHTCGSVSAEIFAGEKENFGVFYPLQTFSKGKKVDFKNVPIFIEGNNDFTLETLKILAKSISENFYILNSEEREKLHLAAVFACNFSNAMCAISSEILGEIPFSVMLPLLKETVEKLQILPPKKAQSGPARRGDENTISRHISALENNPRWREIYKIVTEEIRSWEE